MSLFPAICTFTVDDPNTCIISDHCVIHFSLLAVDKQQDDDGRTGAALKFKNVCDNTRAESYRTALESKEIKVAFTYLKNDISFAATADDINSSVSSFQGVMESVCAPLFKRNIKHSTDEYTLNESKQSWFSDGSREKRSLFYRHLNIYRKNKHDCVLRRNMVNARSEYKKVLRHCRQEHRKSQTEKFVNYQTENANFFVKC